MTHFSVGEQVIIRYGRQQGKKAIISKANWRLVQVKAEDGSILFFSSKGLERETGRVQRSL